MKLIFVENRYKTYFFEQISKRLDDQHDIYWIVQNHAFVPKTGTVLKIPYPKEKDLSNSFVKNPSIEKIIESDRQLNYFKKNDKRYFQYYFEHIENLISEIGPSYVFGEATAFHELLAIEVCKKREIKYLNPSSCRYPVGRFSFYLYDTLIPFKGSNEELTYEEGMEIINSIANRNVKPDYMKPVTIPIKKKVADKLKILKSYYNGEQFNTPSPFVKISLEKQKKKNIERWQEIAVSDISSSTAAIVYALHMQPEANIDVWGRSHRNQLNTIKSIQTRLLNGQTLYVKPNPKSKYELTEELVQYIASQDAIEAIDINTPMTSIYNKIDLVVGVTGTIIMECILSDKPVITLVKTINNEAANCLFAKDFDELGEYFGFLAEGKFPHISDDEKLKFLNTINRTSYKGQVSDPFYSESSISSSNIGLMHAAFKDVLKGKA
ncbi:MAG: hypothetical protein JJ885_01575 [Muricauda sp.]|uniref:hypothetical protein n=1 Tax=Flagellimonas sp. TaxID=2058762 RepID=UPI001B0879E1|nr:hypothetical protein [Allomuricauda sp.]MBO6532582.1 hypothetical protein [Allomuricauda sp.]MBO6588026.1 hypothetical protein [Allomuricauda sp.]MBO6617651.1 hypothetical protein [Allomuricauda sp.]MBO6643338.1 hypothetical protein [Allomuricauda sp.]MBO6745986.1 hypothetical protein [Allomuricauda sp.]